MAPKRPNHGQMSESFYTRDLPLPLRRPAGRLYLPLPGRGLCQCPDRQHRPAQRPPLRGGPPQRRALPCAAAGLLSGRAGGGAGPLALPGPGRSTGGSWWCWGRSRCSFSWASCPPELDMLANALVSFACAMQVQAFRKVDGYAFASTMCVGNLRSGVESLCAWGRTKSPEARRKAGRYFGVILLFALGAGLGSLSLGWWGARAIWFSCVLLAVSFLLMFIREDLEEDPVIRKDLAEIRRDGTAIRQELAKELRQDLSKPKKP